MAERQEPHPKLGEEKVEGSRRTVDEGLEHSEAGEAGEPQAPGITNRPRREEQQEQEELPPRGERKPASD